MCKFLSVFPYRNMQNQSDLSQMVDIALIFSIV